MVHTVNFTVLKGSHDVRKDENVEDVVENDASN